MRTIDLDKKEVLWLDLMVCKLIEEFEEDLKSFYRIEADKRFYNSTISDIEKLKTLREKILFDGEF